MKIRSYSRKKIDALSILSFALPAVPLLIVCIDTVMGLWAKSLGDFLNMYYIAAQMITSVSISGILCGGIGLLCSIRCLRKYGKKKRYIAAIVWNALMILIALPLIVIQLAAK